MTVAAVVSVIGAIISVIGALIALGSQPGPQIMPQMTYRTLIIPADSSPEQKVDATAMKEQENDPSTSSLASASTGNEIHERQTQMSTQKHITPADYGATYNKYLHAWRWWADDRQELGLAVYDDTNLNIDRDPNRAYEIEFFDEANEGITATQLDQLREVIGKALECRKALLKQKQEGE